MNLAEKAAMILDQLNSLKDYLLLDVYFFVIILTRFLLAAGLFYFYFNKWAKKRFYERRIVQKALKNNQIQQELIHSVATSFIFSITGTLSVWFWKSGYLRVYTEIGEWGWLYFLVTPLLLMLIHETYFYWMHRAMHHPRLFRKFHVVHHASIITTPWTAFSFNISEAVLEALILPFLLFLLPVHYIILLFYLVLMTISSIINHLNVEIYPEVFRSNIIGKWIIGATYHSMHHKKFNCNYGLYFKIWDKLLNTSNE